jgi:hypothetical protein
VITTESKTNIRHQPQQQQQQQDPASWRIALNLGRESGWPFWDSYGASGTRLPVIVPTDFFPDGRALPQSETISYTDMEGAVLRRIQGGTWKVSKRQTSPPGSSLLTLSLEFPEALQKKDIVLPAGSVLQLEGLVYSQTALTELEQAFANARKEEWKAQEALAELQAVRDAPKKWNPDTQQWEYPKLEEPLTSLASKHWKAFTTGQERRTRQAAKPGGTALSTQAGRLPGFDDTLVYFAKTGVIRNASQANKVIGTWSAEPILDRPLSYYYPSSSATSSWSA